MDGNGIQGARVSVRGIRHDVTTGNYYQQPFSPRCLSYYRAVLISLPPSPAANGDYWRLLTPGIHIVTATAPGYTKAIKKVHLPARMNKAGRVDFVLQKAADVENDNIATMGNYERFDPYNQYERYTQMATLTQSREERAEKPWWWNYFILSGGAPPTWLLRHH